MAVVASISSGTIFCTKKFHNKWIQFRLFSTIYTILIILWSMSSYIIPVPPQALGHLCDPVWCLRFWFIYLTSISNAITLFYFVFQTFLTIKRAKYKEARDSITNISVDVNPSANVCMEQIYPKCAKCTYYFYVIGFAMSVVVTLVYWTLVFGGFVNVNECLIEIHLHGITTLLFCVDYIGNDFEIRTFKEIIHSILTVIAFDLLYGVFLFLYYLFGGTDLSGHPYIYEIIDFDANFAIAMVYIFAVMILNVLVHFGLIKLKIFLIRSKCCMPKNESNENMSSPMSRGQHGIKQDDAL